MYIYIYIKLQVRIDKATIDLQLQVSRFCDYQVKKYSYVGI